MHFKLLLTICVLAKVGEGCTSEKKISKEVSKGNDTTTTSDAASVAAATTDSVITVGSTLFSDGTTTSDEMINIETETGGTTTPMETTIGGETTTGKKTTGDPTATMATKIASATSPGILTAGSVTTATVTRAVAGTTVGVNFLSKKGDLCSDIGGTPMLSVEECKSSLPWIQETYIGPYESPGVPQQSVSGYPKGCYVFTRYGHALYGVHFNKHHTGSPESRSSQVCKPVTPRS